MGRRKYLVPIMGIEDDPLIFLIEMTYLKKIKTNILLQIAVFLPNTWMAFVIMIAMFNFLIDFNKILIYGANMSMLVQSFSLSLCLWIVKDMILNFTNLVKINCWSLKSAGDDLFSEIKQDCRRLKTISYLLILLTVSSSLTELYFVGDERKWQYTLHLLFTYLKGWKLYLLFIINESVCFTWGYITSIPLMALLYIINHIKFQFRLLNKYLEVIRDEDGELEDTEYQEWIRNNLKQLIQMHVHVIRSSKIIMKYFPYCTVGLLMMALTSFVTPAYFVFAKVSPVSNFRMYFILITCIIQECVGCINCQRMSDESLKMFENATNCHWVNWDKRNKNTLIIFLIKTMEPIQTSAYGIPNANYELILKLWRTGYAILTLFINASENGVIKLNK